MATTRKQTSFALQVFIPTLRTDVDASGIAFSRNLPGPAFALASHSSLALLLVSVSPVRSFAIFSRSVCWGWHDVLYAPHPIVTAPQPRCAIVIVSQHKLLPHTQQKNQTPDRPRDPRFRRAHLRHRATRRCHPHSVPTRHRTRTRSQS